MHRSTEQKHAAKSVINGLNGTPILTLDKIRIPPWKRIQDNLGFWIPHCGFRILGTGFHSLSAELEF